jgi:hypothetical protein
MTTTPNYARAWATGATRDDYIDGQPARGHVAKFRESAGHYRCVKCDAPLDDASLFCAEHLRVQLRP